MLKTRLFLACAIAFAMALSTATPARAFVLPPNFIAITEANCPVTGTLYTSYADLFWASNAGPNVGLYVTNQPGTVLAANEGEFVPSGPVSAPKLMALGTSGSTEPDWIQSGHQYTFILYVSGPAPDYTPQEPALFSVSIACS
jgi:hypothetical protein